MSPSWKGEDGVRQGTGKELIIMCMWLKPEWFINMSTLLIFSLHSIKKKLNSFLRN